MQKTKFSFFLLENVAKKNLAIFKHLAESGKELLYIDITETRKFAICFRDIFQSLNILNVNHSACFFSKKESLPLSIMKEIAKSILVVIKEDNHNEWMNKALF